MNGIHVVNSPEMMRLAALSVNPILDSLNNAFDEFSRVVRARPSLSTATIVESIREELIGFVNVINMQMNTGNVTGLVNHLMDAQKLTRNIIIVTQKVRIENGSRGFHVVD